MEEYYVVVYSKDKTIHLWPTDSKVKAEKMEKDIMNKKGELIDHTRIIKSATEKIHLMKK